MSDICKKASGGKRGVRWTDYCQVYLKKNNNLLKHDHCSRSCWMFFHRCWLLTLPFLKRICILRTCLCCSIMMRWWSEELDFHGNTRGWRKHFVSKNNNDSKKKKTGPAFKINITAAAMNVFEFETCLKSFFFQLFHQVFNQFLFYFFFLNVV